MQLTVNMATIRLRNSGYYVVDFTYNGERYVKTTKTKIKRIAEQVRQDIEAHIALGTFNIKDYQNNSPLLKDVITDYIEDVKVYKSPNTMINEQHYLEQFLESLSNCQLSSISHRSLVNWRNDRLQHIGRTTANIERRVLHTFLNWCIKRGYIKENPVNSLPKLSVEEKNRLYFTNDELMKLITIIEKARLSARGSRDMRFMEQFQLLVFFLLYTGLRLGEALALQYSDIDQEKGLAHIYQPKVKKSRVVPLHPIAIDVLYKLGPDLFKRLNGHHVSRKFRYFLLLAGLKGFKLHSLRHTFASNLTQLGSNILVVKELLGHSDIRTTMIYAKTNVESLQREVLKIKRELPASDILVTQKGMVKELCCNYNAI